MRATIVLLIAVTAACSAFGDAFNGATWMNRGPINIAGVVTSLLIDPDQTAVYIAGTGGGLFTSNDGGATWSVMPVLEGRSIQALARDPLRHDVLWAGTSALFNEEGLFRSADRGKTWTPVAASRSLPVYSVAVSPKDSSVIAAIATGLLLSSDGTTWRAINFPTLFAPQLRFHPTDGNRAIAVHGKNTTAGIHPAPFVTSDGGLTWHEATGIDSTTAQGLTIEFSPAQPSVAFAFATGVPYVDSGVMYRSDDSGETFRRTGQSQNVGDRMRVIALYASPVNPNVTVNGAVNLYRSIDNGTSDSRIDRLDLNTTTYIPHADYRGMSGIGDRRLIVWGDGGVYRTDDILAAQPNFIRLPSGMVNAQIYSFDVSASGNVVFGMQDTGVGILHAGSAAASPSVDGDFYHVALDPTDESVYFSENFPGWIYRSTQVSFPLIDTRAGRSVFDSDFVIDPNAPTRMFAGSALIVRADLIQTAHPLITTLRTNDPGVYATAIAVQRGNSNVVWFADNLGGVYRTDAALTSAPAWQQIVKLAQTDGPVNRIIIDGDDARRVTIVCRDAIKLSTDGGASWRTITGTAPSSMRVSAFQDAVRHPIHRDWIYVATGHGLWSTTDAGASWSIVAHPVLQTIATTGVDFMPGTSTLWVSTYGRGMWSAEIPPVPPRRRSVRR